MDEMEARVRIWRVEAVWMCERVRLAREAEGRRERAGIVRDSRLYDTPYWMLELVKGCRDVRHAALWLQHSGADRVEGQEQAHRQ